MTCDALPHRLLTCYPCDCCIHTPIACYPYIYKYNLCTCILLILKSCNLWKCLYPPLQSAFHGTFIDHTCSNCII